jgi:hypothetical protein
MRSPLHRMKELLREPVRLQALGIFYLDNPPAYRFL